MKKIAVDSYKLNRISNRMAEAFGTIPKGQEEFFAYPLSAMEGNMLKLHRQDPGRTGRHALTAIQMALLTVDGYLRQMEVDFSRFATPENQSLLRGLLLSFDPYSNPEIREAMKEMNTVIDDKEYFITPIKCLLRIQKSVEMWTKEWGPGGYFKFIEDQMGSMVQYDDRMEFSILVHEDSSATFKRLDLE